MREPYRSVLLLRFYEGLAPSEIARRRDVPAATVRSQLHRGLETLRGALDERYGDDRRRWALAAVPLATCAPRGATALGVAHKVAVALILLAGSVAFGRWALRPTGERAETTAGGTAIVQAAEVSAPDAGSVRDPIASAAPLVTGDEPFDLAPVRRAAREAAAVGSEAAPPLLEIHSGLEQSVFTLTKESVS